MINMGHLILLLLFNLLGILVAVYIIEKKIRDIERINDDRYNYFDDLTEKNETDISNLYAEDNHGMSRPKVDMLADDIYEDVKK